MSESYTLLISEKPQSAVRIANALAESSLRKVGKRVYWLEFKRNGKKHVIAPAVGHLLILVTKEKEWKYPVFDVEWVATFTKKGSEFTKRYYDNIERLAKKADDFIICTDFDREGETIGLNILRFICKKEDAKRMKFSTLTKEDLVESYENMLDHLDFDLAEAGLTRHYLDFFYGINTTRALTLAMKEFLRGFAVVSSGRVQSPTLKILVDRELEIKKFEPVPYWQLELHCLLDGEVLIALYRKERIWEKSEAENISDECKGKDAIVKDIEKRKYQKLPPTPFNTTSLQTEAYRCFGFSPRQTMGIAEVLYNQALISYPRTSSQKLPKKVGYKKILEGLSKISRFQEITKELLSKKVLKPREGKKEDPAHTSIYPTGEIPERLSNDQQRLYNLIVRRFFSVFGDPAIREVMNVVLTVNKHEFVLKGKRTIKPGWFRYYGKFAKFEEQVLPGLKKGQVLKVKELEMLEKETQPPDRYTQGSIIKEMSNKGLGTKATRAHILQTLYDRGYIRGKSIMVTKFGEKVIEVLKEHCPRIVSEELTKKFEKEMEFIEEKEKTREEVVEGARKVLTEILSEFKDNEDKIGKALSKAYIEFKKKQKLIGTCPKCGNNLKIIRSKKSGKRFVGCEGYFKGVCDFSSSIPQKGRIQPIDTKCKYCGYLMVMVLKRGRKSWFLCLNPDCPGKKG